MSLSQLRLPIASTAETFTLFKPAKAVMVPFQISSLCLVSSMLFAVTLVTPISSVAFTVTRIAVPVIGVLVLIVTLLMTGLNVSKAVNTTYVLFSTVVPFVALIHTAPAVARVTLNNTLLPDPTVISYDAACPSI